MSVKNKFLVTLFFLVSICSIFAQNTREIEGFWKARGYGWIAHIDATKIKMYDVTEISCYPSETYPIAVFMDDVKITNNVLTLTRGASKYTLDKLDKVPDLCERKLSKKEERNPVLNFEILWRTFQEQYVYFKERNIDWKALYEVYAPQVNEKTSDAELFKICNAMLSELNDAHVGIEASDKIMRKAKKLENEDTSPKASFTELRKAIVTKYLKAPKTHNLKYGVYSIK